MTAQHGDHHIIVRTLGGQELVLEDLPDRDGVKFELRAADDPQTRETFILQGDEVAEIGGWLYGLVLAYAAKIDPRHPSQYRGN